jgi:hypothetical protein
LFLTLYSTFPIETICSKQQGTQICGPQGDGVRQIVLDCILNYFVLLVFCLQEKDPFWEPADSSEVLIGSVHIYLQSVAYLVELAENLAITDYKGNDQGHLEVEIRPTDAKGKDLGEDVFVENPSELVSEILFIYINCKKRSTCTFI